MKSFKRYISEKMDETGDVAPVTNYFSHAPVLRLQRDIPRLLDLLKHGKLHSIQKTMRLGDLIPTQEVVALPKVYGKYRQGDKTDHPIVVLHDRGTRQSFIIDGHHRASALILGGTTMIPVTVIDSLDAARVLA